MDLDKMIVFLKTLGFPVAIAVWFLWKIQVYMEATAASGVITNELLRQLIAIHK